MSRNRKWDGTAHWVVPGRYLGEDRHGWWIFQAAGESDLDVIRSVERGVFVDDEDGFAEHRRTMAYPASLVHTIVAECERLHRAVKDSVAPFNGSDSYWFRRGRA